jgi:hypothetical protein
MTRRRSSGDGWQNARDTSFISRQPTVHGSTSLQRWFAELTNKRIRRGAFRSLKELETAIREYIGVHNEDPRLLVWTKAADQFLDSIARFARRTLVVHASET